MNCLKGQYFKSENCDALNSAQDCFDLAEQNDIEWISGNFKCQELPYDATNSRHPVISEVECLFI